MKSILTIGLLAVCVSIANGQTSSIGESPINATYNSAFDVYLPWGDASIASWTKSNDLVQERGGWRSYAKEADQERRRLRELKELGGSK